MKAKDLMINNFVYFNCFDGTRITVKVTGFKDNIVYGISENSSHWCTIEKVEPIPLTPEILEKNDSKKFPFSHIEGQHKWTWWKNFATSITLWCRVLNDDTKDGMMLKIEAPTSTLCIKVNYVHELQHALKLCGIEKEIKL